ncbi:hypothetical protein F5883DRAFT_553132 [Diaporthe sp. PMI_573]|nr:hypothetical protein F5883DRAFT_553132 [Diaporthaceae sp. PMI_573]
MSSYYEYDQRRPAARAPASRTDGRSSQRSTGGITQGMASMSLSKKPASQKSSAEDEWESIRRASPRLYDAMLKASDIMRKLEASRRIRPFRVGFPTILPAPSRTAAYASSGRQQPGYGREPSRTTQTIARPLQPAPSRGSSSTQRIASSSSSSARHACKYCGKKYEDRARRDAHQKKH